MFESWLNDIAIGLDSNYNETLKALQLRLRETSNSVQQTEIMKKIQRLKNQKEIVTRRT
jgi:hypothetical protein